MRNVLLLIKRMAVLSGVMAILFLCLVSCKLRSSQLTFHHIGDQGWRSTDTCHFPVDSLLDSGTYELSVAFRSSSAFRYPYRQLVLEVSSASKQSASAVVDTLTCNLTQRDGEVVGRGVGVYAYEFPVDTLLLHKDSIDRVSIRHLMRTSPLKGVYDIGILLRKIS